MELLVLILRLLSRYEHNSLGLEAWVDPYISLREAREACRDIEADHLHFHRLLLGAGGHGQQAAEQVLGKQTGGRMVYQGVGAMLAHIQEE